MQLCESDGSGGVKTQAQGFMQVTLKGCRMDLFSHNNDWTNIQMGISEATVKPEGDCCCGVSELAQVNAVNEYRTKSCLCKVDFFKVRNIQILTNLTCTY